MKANLPKSFNQLSKNEQDRILKAYREIMDAEICDTQIIWIKMACCILHDIGLTEEQIMLFIGGWKGLYRKNARIKDKQEQDAFLEPRLAAIFGENGFPEEFVQSFKQMGDKAMFEINETLAREMQEAFSDLLEMMAMCKEDPPLKKNPPKKSRISSDQKQGSMTSGHTNNTGAAIIAERNGADNARRIEKEPV